MLLAGKTNSVGALRIKEILIEVDRTGERSLEKDCW